MTEHLEAIISRADPAVPILVAVGVWWLGTTVVLLLDGLPRSTHRRSLLAATALALAAFAGLAITRSLATPAGAYAAFLCAIVIWGWNELTFLTGRITGPRRTACAEGCRGPRHVTHAVATVLHHELAIAACGAGVFALAWDAANPVGAWTFAVLWAMRISAKLNLFLGVPNLSEDLLPPHLGYLERYFNRRRMNVLFPFSVTAGTVVTTWLAQHAFAADATAFEAAGYGLVTSLMALAVLEHWFFVVPIPSTTLWQLGLRSHAAADEPDARPAGGGAEVPPLRAAPVPAAHLRRPSRPPES